RYQQKPVNHLPQWSCNSLRHAKKSKQLREDGQDRGPHNGAAEAPHSPKDHHQENVDGLHHVKGRRIDKGDVMRIKAPGETCENRPQGEGKDLISVDVLAHSQSRDLILSDPTKYPAKGR